MTATIENPATDQTESDEVQTPARTRRSAEERVHASALTELKRATKAHARASDAHEKSMGKITRLSEKVRTLKAQLKEAQGELDAAKEASEGETPTRTALDTATRNLEHARTHPALTEDDLAAKAEPEAASDGDTVEAS